MSHAMLRPRPILLASAVLVACVLGAGCARDSEAEAADAARRAAADIETLPSPEAGVGSVTGMPEPGEPGARREMAVADPGAESTPAAVADVDVDMDMYVESGMADDRGGESMEADADPGVVADAGALPLPPPPQPQAVVVPLERGQLLPPPPPPPPASAPEPQPATQLPVPPPASGDEPAAQ